MFKFAPLPTGLLVFFVFAIAWKCYHLEQKVEWTNVAKSYDIRIGTGKGEAVQMLGIPDEVIPNGMDSTYRYQVPLTSEGEIQITFDSLQRVVKVVRLNQQKGGL